MTHLKSLSLYQFRNYEKQHVTFGPKLNIIVGKNGQGKTNCLEAIALLISGKSFRSPYLRELIFHQNKAFHLRADFVKNQIEQTLGLSYSPEGKKMFYNGSTSMSFLPLIGVLQGVFFAGFYDELIKGSPQIRRRFLNLQCAQVDPLYVHHLTHYQKALKERNFLLKKGSTSSMEIYEELMAKSIPYLITKRLELLRAVEKKAQVIHSDLSGGGDEIRLVYKSPFLSENGALSPEECLKLLHSQRSKEVHFGYSLVGPHKDELLIYLKGQQAKKYSSEGQVQTLMLSIYLAEFEHLEETLEESPLFCIDDFGQNLDEGRQKRLLDRLQNMGQVFITMPEIPRYSLSEETQVFEVDQGSIYATAATSK